MNRAVQIVAVVVLIAVVGVSCFYGGMVYGKGQSTTTTTTAAAGGPPQGGAFSYGQGVPGAGQFAPGAGQGGATAPAGMLVGQVDSVADGTVTITDSSGKLVQIKATDTTLIQKQASVAVTDLQKGDQVIVSASKAADGTYTARSIQVATGPNSLAPANAGGGPGLGGGSTNPGGGFPGGAPGVPRP